MIIQDLTHAKKTQKTNTKQMYCDLTAVHVWRKQKITVLCKDYLHFLLSLVIHSFITIFTSSAQLYINYMQVSISHLWGIYRAEQSILYYTFPHLIPDLL